MTRTKKGFFVQLLHLGMIAIAITGCQRNAPSQNNHEMATPKATIGNTDRPQKVTPLSEFNSVEFQNLNLQFSQAKTKEEKMKVATVVLDKLEDFVLNTKHLDNPEYQGSEDFVGALSLLNRVYVYLLTENKLTQERLDRYAFTLMTGCDFELQGCIYTRFFSKDYNSSRILLFKANAYDREISALSSQSPEIRNSKELRLVRDYYFVLRLAKLLKGRSGDMDLNIAFAKRARLYSDLIEALPGEQVSTYERRLLELIGKTFETALNEIRSNNNAISDPRVQEIIKDFNPWTYSRLDKSKFNFGTSIIYSLAAQTQLYTENGELNQDLKKAMVEIQTKGDKYGPSFSSIVAEIRKRKNVLDLKYVDQYANFNSEIFYLVDRLYRDHLREEDIRDLWVAIKRNKGATAEKEILEVVQYYTRIEMLRMKNKSVDYSVEMYKNDTYGQETLIVRVIEDSRDLFNEWSDTKRSLDRLIGFLDTAISVDSVNRKELEKTRLLVESLKKNIKLFAAYPLQFILAYYLKKLDAELTLKGWFGEFKIPAGTVIKAFLEGALGPWFNFGNDRDKLNQVDLMYAFGFALEGGVFEGFQSEKLKEDNRVYFESYFNSVIKDYLSHDNEMLKKADENLDDLEGKNSYRTMSRICDSSGNENRLAGHEVQISYDELENSPLIGSLGSLAGGLMGAYHSNIYGPSAGNGAMKTIRELNEVFPKHKRIVEIMTDVLNDYLKRKGATAKTRDKIYQESKSALSSIENKFHALYRRTLKLHRQFKKINANGKPIEKYDDCYRKLAAYEMDYIIQLMSEERDRLVKVYRFGQQFKGLSTEQIREKIRVMSEDPNNKTIADLKLYGDTFEGGPKYIISKRGLYDRMIEKLSTLKPIRVSVLGRPSDSVLIDKPVTIDLDLNLSESDFIAYFAGTVNTSDSKFIKWMKDPTQFESRLERVSALTTLYSTGELLGLPAADRILPEELLEEMRSVVGILDLDKSKQLFLSQFGRSSLVSGATVRSMFYSTTGQKGLFDFIFDRLVLDNRIGADTALTVALGFYQSFVAEDVFTFKPDEAVVSAIYSAYAPSVKVYDTQFTDLLSAIKVCQESKEYPCEDNFAIVTDLRQDEPIYKSMGSRSQRQFLNDTKQRVHADIMTTFHNNTCGEFKDGGINICTSQKKKPRNIRVSDQRAAAIDSTADHVRETNNLLKRYPLNPKSGSQEKKK